MSDTINVCMLGYGLSAKVFHIPYILLTPGLVLHSILQRSPTADNDAAKDHPSAKIHRSLDDVLGDPEIRLVIVGTGNSSHYPMTKALLEAGKDVMVEKPFTIRTEEADELVQLAESKGRLLTVYHNRRWDADFLTLRRLLAEDTFGTLVSLETHFDRYKAPGTKKESWKTVPVPGSGILFDLGSHLIDQVLVLFGLPSRVFASVRDERGASEVATAGWGDEGFIDDTFDAMLFYDTPPKGIDASKRGFVVKLSATTTSLCERQVRYVVRGVKAGYNKYGLDLQEDQTRGGMDPADAAFGIETENEWGTLTTAEGSVKVKSEDGRYKGLFENVAQALLGKTELVVKASEAADVIRVINLLGKSSREGRVLEVRK